jgi:hypothetical protein
MHNAVVLQQPQPATLRHDCDAAMIGVTNSVAHECSCRQDTHMKV